MTFGECLYQLRKEHHFSQEDLAEQLHVSRQSVSRWENGSASPDFEKATQLAQLFGVTLDHLVNGAATEAETEPKKPKEKLPTWRIVVGALLLLIGGSHLCNGLLSRYEFDYYLFMVLPLLACGLLILLTRKYTPLFCLWAVYWCLSYGLYISFSWHWSHITLTFTQPTEAFRRYIPIGWCLFAALLAMLLISARTLRKVPVNNPKRHLLFTGLLFAMIILVPVLFDLWAKAVLNHHLTLVHSGLFYFSNLVMDTVRLVLLTAFCIFLARWLYHRKKK